MSAAGGLEARLRPATATTPMRDPTKRHSASIAPNPIWPSVTMSRICHGAVDPSSRRPTRSPSAAATGTSESAAPPSTIGQERDPLRDASSSQTCAAGTKSSARKGFASQARSTAPTETSPSAGAATSLPSPAGTRHARAA